MVKYILYALRGLVKGTRVIPLVEQQRELIEQGLQQVGYSAKNYTLAFLSTAPQRPRNSQIPPLVPKNNSLQFHGNKVAFKLIRF